MEQQKFNHYIYVIIYIFVYLPTTIMFNYFINDPLFYMRQHQINTTSATAFIVAIIIVYTQRFHFLRWMRNITPIEYTNEIEIFIKECKNFSVFPMFLSKEDIETMPSSCSEIIDIKKSLAEYRTSCIIMFCSVIILGIFSDHIFHMPFIG